MGRGKRGKRKKMGKMKGESAEFKKEESRKIGESKMKSGAEEKARGERAKN